jgi:multiple sugar transport system ATP-binding protein
MTSVSLRNLTKIFGDESSGTVAVDDLSLDIADGEFLVFLGPSGCGKTTTLRMIGGLETPTSGSVSFNDTVVNDVKARNRDIAMVFQDFALYPHMSVRRNLGFGLEREDNDLSREEIDEQVEDVAAMLEIGDLLDNKPNELSGGQKQRVALGRAVVRQPRLFLFDEPLANLDAKLRKNMRTEIEGLQSELGITSAYVTHNQEEAMTIADTIAILNAGELQQAGTPDEVFNEPANTFVAQFVGSPNINLFDGTIEQHGDEYRIHTEAFALTLPADTFHREPTSDPVIVGIRPQDFTHAWATDTVETVIESSVNLIEPLGTEAVVHGESGEKTLTAMVSDYHRIDKDQPVTFAIDPRHVYVFDDATDELLKPRYIEGYETRGSNEDIDDAGEIDSDGVEV